tara:strand:+ start:359 stop:523 length:165 start_codon:yes stop_codon:yes gene_type:complete
MFIETERINIKEMKFADMAVISHPRKPFKPNIKKIAYKVEISEIITHLISLKIK